MKTIQEILEQEHAFNPDGETLYAMLMFTDAVCYDYHDEEGITDYELISDYQSLSEKNSND